MERYRTCEFMESKARYNPAVGGIQCNADCPYNNNSNGICQSQGLVGESQDPNFVENIMKVKETISDLKNLYRSVRDNFSPELRKSVKDLVN